MAIARALVNDPHVILATSRPATSTRAPATRSWRCSPSLNKAGKTIIMVTHENDIAAWARRVIRLRDGRIESDERHRRNCSCKFRVSSLSRMTPNLEPGTCS